MLVFQVSINYLERTRTYGWCPPFDGCLTCARIFNFTNRSGSKYNFGSGQWSAIWQYQKKQDKLLRSCRLLLQIYYIWPNKMHFYTRCINRRCHRTITVKVMHSSVQDLNNKIRLKNHPQSEKSDKDFHKFIKRMWEFLINITLLADIFYKIITNMRKLSKSYAGYYFLFTFLLLPVSNAVKGNRSGEVNLNNEPTARPVTAWTFPFKKKKVHLQLLCKKNKK